MNGVQRVSQGESQSCGCDDSSACPSERPQNTEKVKGASTGPAMYGWILESLEDNVRLHLWKTKEMFRRKTACDPVDHRHDSGIYWCMTMPRPDDARDESTYELLLLSLDDGMDGTLFTLLDPMGQAIAESIAGSTERIAVMSKRYGEDAAEMMASEAAVVVEDFLGVAFVAAQTYITAVVSRLIKLHQYSLRWNNAKLTTTSGLKEEIMRYGFRPTQKGPYSKVEVMNAFANYYKHRDEWDYEWGSLKGHQQETATIISSAGAFQSSTCNLRTGAAYLGNLVYANVSAFGKLFSNWRKDLIHDYKTEIRRRGLK